MPIEEVCPRIQMMDERLKNQQDVQISFVLAKRQVMVLQAMFGVDAC